jgi:spermidine/putrescine transport system permease protein
MLERERPEAPWWAVGCLIGGLALLYFPLVYLVFGSVAERTPEGWTLTWRWYAEILADGSILQALGRSVAVAVANATIATALGAAAALALTRTGFRFKRTLQGLSALTLVLPELVFALALLSWFAFLKLPLSLTTVVMAHVTFSISFVLLTVVSRLMSFDSSLEEAAKDLGARDWDILTRIYLPFLSPALLTSFLFCLILSFDDFLITYFTNGIGSDTLPIRLYSSMKMGHSPKLNALSCLMIALSGFLIIVLMKRNVYRDILR